ncbi:MAG: YggS family pyridoxal phosphate-dependent enzyme [Caldilineaceae bacterium]
MSETTAAVRNSEIAANLADVSSRIVAAARRVGRDPATVTLVAVSKTKPMAAIEAAYRAGQRDFGENRVEELWEKVKAAEQLGLSAIRWHLIGTIQSRKSAQAVGPFALIHSVDREKIATRLSRDASAANCVLSVLLETNVSGEASKQGFAPDELLAEAAKLLALPNLQIVGLMTMAPLVEEPEATRPVFRRLRELRDQLRERYSASNWPHLSMGMTNDFEIAVEEGATLVRVGSAIFGSR